jgi:dUTP pyrophosphatase
MNKNSNIDLKIIDPRIEFNLPRYETSGAAAIDLRAAISSEIVLYPGKCLLVPSGIAIHIADKNIAGLIVPRSGLGHKEGLILGNSVGLIDSDYQGEIKISLWNRSTLNKVIKPLDRVAQLIFIPVMLAKFNIVENFKSSARGDKGFGSTGV